MRTVSIFTSYPAVGFAATRRSHDVYSILQKGSRPRDRGFPNTTVNAPVDESELMHFVRWLVSCRFRSPVPSLHVEAIGLGGDFNGLADARRVDG
jgi:hypothetical protein